MSRIVMVAIALVAFSLISVNVIKDYVIDPAKESKGTAKVEQPKSANPLNARSTASGPGPETGVGPDTGFLE